MNAVIIAVVVMLVLSFLRVNVVFALIAGALVGGLTGGLSIEKTIEVFSNGLGGSAEVALSYALLGGFAVAISRTGLPNLLVEWVLRIVRKEGDTKAKSLSKGLIIFIIGFSPMATIALVGTAVALGDAGSPASDSTLGPTAGLNADGQHNHIWDTCVPTFLHYNIPVIIFGWIAAMVL